MKKNTQRTPRCIGIIMDGNRRFAKEHGLRTIEGHKAGYEKLKEVAEWMREAGVAYAIVYAFSNENWKRPPQEVNQLFHLIEYACKEELGSAERENICIRVIGERGKLPKQIQCAIVKLEEKTAENTAGTLVIALSYSGRAEIARATSALAKEGKKNITEEDIAEKLYTKDIPDPDMIIRTSGETRLSNFLLWQSAYSELFFTKTYWPAFSKKEFFEMLREFSERERRMGK